MMNKQGYYWVKFKGRQEYEIAFRHLDGVWGTIGGDYAYRDCEVDQVYAFIPNPIGVEK
jgi:hypothetical protein